MIHEDADNEHVKTVYAKFGLAVYFGQCLEHALANALWLFDFIPRKTPAIKSLRQWQAECDSFLGQQFAHTLGQLIKNLKSVISIDEALEGKLAEALTKRNWLVHHYFRERALEFMHPAGRDTMIGELEQVQALFEEASRLLNDALRPVQIKYEITNERVEDACRQMLDTTETDDE